MKFIINHCSNQVCDVDAKVIDDQGEGNRSRVVFPQAWGVAHRMVTVWRQVLLEAVVGYFSGMGEPVHSLFYLAIYPSVVFYGAEVVLVDDFKRDDGQFQFHVLVLRQGSA